MRAFYCQCVSRIAAAWAPYALSSCSVSGVNKHAACVTAAASQARSWSVSGVRKLAAYAPLGCLLLPRRGLLAAKA